MKRTNKKHIPRFTNEDQERKFWAKHSPLDYFDVTRARKITLGNLRPSVKRISIRLPEMMLEQLKSLANKRDIPYQSLLKMFLAERIEAELQRTMSR